MLRLNWMSSATAAKNYFSSTDYYATCPGEWLGKGAEMLGLVGSDNQMHFYSMADNLNPQTGQILRPHAKDGDRVGMDLTFNSTKSVGLARELAGPDNAGDPRIEAAHREAVKYAMGFVEADMQTRVRVGKADHDRMTGNMVAYRVTHRDTRISAEDQMPDMSLHCHVFIFNATHDPIEDKWKACQMGQIKHDAPYYEAIFHARLASNLRDLGYGIRRDGKAFEIEGVSRDLIEKFSRRRQYIKAVAEKLGITSAKSMDKLGATTRLGKTKEVVENLNGYFVSRLTQPEREQLQALQGKPSYECSTEKAVGFAIGHMFERSSVVEEKRLYETALRHGIGSVTVDGVQQEAKRQGLLVKGREASTKLVLAEESRIIDFARDGRGTCRAMGFRLDSPPSNLTHGYDQSASRVQYSHTLLNQRGPAAEPKLDTATLPALAQEKSRPDESKRLHSREAKSSSPNPVSSKTATLSPEQQAICKHVWESPDRVILIRGAAGTGKTHTMKTTIAGINAPVAVLAPTVDASRVQLRTDFPEANTVAAFINDKKWQQRLKNGVIYIDEAPLTPIQDIYRIFGIAEEQNARVILQGDPKQHKSVARHGDLFHVLQIYAGLPVAELKEIRRQSGEYKEAIKAIDEGDRAKGIEILDELGWINRVESDDVCVKVAEECWKAIKRDESFIVIGITHEQNDAITAAIRERLRGEGKIANAETPVECLKTLAWSEAERGDIHRYEGSEIIRYRHDAGSFKAGSYIRVSGWKSGDRLGGSKHFTVCRPESLCLSSGDTIRATDSMRTLCGHQVENGGKYVVKSVNEKDVTLTNGWRLDRSKLHIAHGLVDTSYKVQGKDKDRVIAVMTEKAVPAMYSAQFYVDLSRGRRSVSLVTDLSTQQILDAAKRQDRRKSATELLTPKLKSKRNRVSKVRTLIERVKRTYAHLRDKTEDVIRHVVKQPEREHYVSR